MRNSKETTQSTKCLICDFCLATATLNFPSQKITICLDFVISKEHAFIRNIFDQFELKQSDWIIAIEKYHELSRKILQIIVLLNTRYSNKSDIEDITDNCLA